MRPEPFRPAVTPLEGRVVPSTYKVSNIAYGTASPAQVLDVFSNTTYTSAPVAVLIHGGQFSGGDKRQVEGDYANYFLSQGFVVVAPNYRLVTSNGQGGFTNPFPTGMDDVASAIAWLQAHASTYGANPHEIVVVGPSAGADIGSLLAYDPAATGITGSANWGQSSPITGIVGVIGDSGEYDWSLVPASKQSVVQDYLGSDYPPGGNFAAAGPWHQTEPITYAAPGDTPTLVIGGTNDTVAPYQNSYNLAKALGLDPTTPGVISANHHEFLSYKGYTHGEFSQNFAGSSSEQAAVTTWLKAIGL